MSSGHGKRAKKHEEEHEEEGGSERWLVTYADMLTLLMVLFIVLFASSSIDKKKYAGLQKSLSKAFNDGSPATAGGTGILSGGTVQTDQGGMQNGNPAGPGAAAGSLTADPELSAVSQKVQQDLSSKGLKSSVSQTIDSRGLVITIVTDKVLFQSGSAVLLPGGQKVLNALAPALVNTGRAIEVDGYTDTVPISGSAYADNFWLSDARAETVRHVLLANGVDAPDGDGLKASGYGATNPVASNATAGGRNKNRRVEIVVAPSDSTAATGTTAAKTASDVAPAGPGTAKVAKGGAVAGLLPPVPTAAVTAFPPLSDTTGPGAPDATSIRPASDSPTAPTPGGIR